MKIKGIFCIAVALCMGLMACQQNRAVSPVDTPVSFVDLSEGDAVIAQANSLSYPTASVSLRVDLDNVSDIYMTANGEDVASYHNTSTAVPFTVDLEWTVFHGDGAYALYVSVLDPEKIELGSASIQVQVTGAGPDLAAQATVQADAQDTAALARIIELYQSEFNLTLQAPPVAQKERAGAQSDPWASNIYLGDMNYQVYLYPDGTFETSTLYLGQPGSHTERAADSGASPCIPTGEYSMLVVFVDYGNLAVTAEDAEMALRQATDLANADYANYTSNSGFPILQLRTQAAFVQVPIDLPESMYLTPEMVLTMTGLDITQFDWFTQVDLDSAQTARLSWGTLEQTSFGYAMGGCDQNPEGIDIWVNIDDAGQLFGEANRLTDVLLMHEVYHLFGYPGSHAWVCNDGSVPDPSDCCGYHAIPSLELGWTDTDDDGTPEILDLISPYGLMMP